MTGMFDILLQCVKDRFPKLNWKLGSVIRTLLIDPLKTIGDEVDSYVNKLQSMADITELLDSPEGREDEIDAWMSRLGLSLPPATASSGKVSIICDTNTQTFTIAEGTAFMWGDDIKVFASSTVTVNEDKKLDTLVDNRLYRLIIDVISPVDIPVSLEAGSRLTWGSAPDCVQDIYVYSALTGGNSDNSLQNKVALIRSAIQTPTMCGAESIRAALIRKFGPIITDVKLGRRELSADSSEVPVYIKQKNLPDMSELPVKSSELIVKTSESGSVIYEFTVKLEANQFIYKVTDASGLMLDCNIVIDGDTATCTYEELSSTTKGTVSSVGTTTPFTVYVLTYSTVATAINWMNSIQCGSPFSMSGRYPVYCTVSLQLNVGDSTISNSAMAAICDYINGSTLGATLSDTAIKNILAEYGYNLQSPVLYTAEIVYKDIRTSTTQLGSLCIPSINSAASVPAALYCSFNNIKVY